MSSKKKKNRAKTAKNTAHQAKVTNVSVESRPNATLGSESTGEQTLVKGALILTIGTIIVKIIGAIFRLPLTNIIGTAGLGYFSAAYALYTPIYTVCASGFTSALSRVIAEANAEMRYRDVRKTHKIARMIFLITGLLGFIVMTVVGSFVYIRFVDENSIYAILTMCPTVFFCCMMAAYRGYYEGSRNMYPTAVSQVIEALGKLILGLGLAIGIVKYGEHQYGDVAYATMWVYGEIVHSLDEAHMVSYKYAAAGALMGIMLGSLFGLVYLMLRHKFKGDRITKADLERSPAPADTKSIVKKFFSIGIPIALGSLVLTLTQVIDASTIQTRIEGLDLEALNEYYVNLCGIKADGTNLFNYKLEEIPNVLYGAYSSSISIYNLVPYITQALGISALPVIAAAWVRKDSEGVRKNLNSVIRIVVLIGMPAGLGIFALAGPILQLLYPGTDAAIIAEPMLRLLGIMIIFGTLVTPLNSMLQAVGKQTVPVKLMLIGAAIKILLNYALVGVQDINIKGAPIGSICCYAFIVVCSIYILCKTTKVKIDFAPTFIKPFISAAGCALAAWGVCELLSGALGVKIAAVLGILVAVVVYFVLIIMLKVLSKEDVLMLPKGEKIAKLLEKRGWIG